VRSEFEKKAIFALTQYHDSPYKLGSALVIPNCSLLGHECDVLIISKNDYATEIELKASISDLKADKKKLHAHKSPYIRQLYFGISEDIPDAALEHVPEHAGIICFFERKENTSWRKGTLCCRILRRPKPNKDALKITEQQKQHILMNMYYRYYNLLFKTEWEEINKRRDCERDPRELKNDL